MNDPSITDQILEAWETFEGRFILPNKMNKYFKGKKTITWEEFYNWSRIQDLIKDTDMDSNYTEEDFLNDLDKLCDSNNQLNQ